MEIWEGGGGGGLLPLIPEVETWRGLKTLTKKLTGSENA